MPGSHGVWQRFLNALGRGESTSQYQRRRIAADLHDGPMQSVIALQMRLAAARSLSERDPEAALKELGDLAELAGAVVAEFRAFQQTLSPPPAASSDLGTLARRLTEEFGKASGLEVRFQAPEGPLTAPPETCLEVGQILREALANVRRHARATRVAVTLAEGAEIVVEDDGGGFLVSGRFTLAELEARGAGPRSIMQRVRDLGGELTLESRPGRGSRLAIKVPI